MSNYDQVFRNPDNVVDNRHKHAIAISVTILAYSNTI